MTLGKTLFITQRKNRSSEDQNGKGKEGWGVEGGGGIKANNMLIRYTETKLLDSEKNKKLKKI